MFNSRLSVGSQSRQASPFRNSLGNMSARNNGDVINHRRTYFMSSTYNLYYLVKIVKMYLSGWIELINIILEIVTMIDQCFLMPAHHFVMYNKHMFMPKLIDSWILKVNSIKSNDQKEDRHGKWRIIPLNFNGQNIKKIKIKHKKYKKQKNLLHYQAILCIKHFIDQAVVTMKSWNFKCQNMDISKALFIFKNKLQLK